MSDIGEIQYQQAIKFISQRGLSKLGLHASWSWHDDPKRFLFTLSRYKFVSKMLAGSENVLEIGCADGFSSRLVAQTVQRLVAIDFDRTFIDSAKSTYDFEKFPVEFKLHNILEAPFGEKFQAIYGLDIFEHISLDKEDQFIVNIIDSLDKHGTCILGSPSSYSQIYASKLSREGHVNCKTQDELGDLMRKYFRNVFLFSMNDELVHTGFSKMANYNFVLCSNPIRKN